MEQTFTVIHMDDHEAEFDDLGAGDWSWVAEVYTAAQAAGLADALNAYSAVDGKYMYVRRDKFMELLDKQEVARLQSL